MILASLAGASVPLVIVGGYVLTRPQGIDWTLLSMLVLSTLVGTVFASVRICSEAVPLIRISRSLRRFAEGGEWRAVPCNLEDAVGEISGAAQKLAATVADLERKNAEAMRTDTLTGLANRAAFIAAIAERPLANIALIGMDRLKEINDLDGQKAGDGALRGFADAMTAELGPNDILARWSGSQFILYLADCDPDRASETLETARRIFSESASIEQRRLVFSAGVVAMSGDFDLDITAAGELLRAARQSDTHRIMTPMTAIENGAGDLRGLSTPENAFDTPLEAWPTRRAS